MTIKEISRFKCPHCQTNKEPTKKIIDNEVYFFCERCKKTVEKNV